MFSEVPKVTEIVLPATATAVFELFDAMATDEIVGSIVSTANVNADPLLLWEFEFCNASVNLFAETETEP